MSKFKQFIFTSVIGFISGTFAAAMVIAAVAAFIWFKPNTVRHLYGQFMAGTPMMQAGPVAIPAIPSAEGDNQVVAVVDQVTPAVVSVVATKDVPVYEQYYGDQDFFGFQFPQYRQKGTESQEVSSGSGFFVSQDGYIVTNKHVVSDEDADYTVFANDGTKYPATVTAVDPANDIAVLKVEGDQFTYLEFADSDAIKVGQTTLAIGNALGEFSNSVSVGIVSGLSRSIEAGDGTGSAEQLQNIIQTDAAINPGNSGGPLLNLEGKVIGVNVAMANAENIGFALPANLVQSVVDSVKTTGKISRPYLGVRYVMLNEKIKTANNLTVDQGALVVRGETPTDLAVVPGSPADKAGIEENDIILTIDGKELTEDYALSTALNGHKVGDSVKLRILHDGEEREVTVALEERK